VDDRGVDRLFSLPLAEFVTARNELAKAIKSTGDKETAARIQKLPKPSISAWAINQVARKDNALVIALIEALDRQRELQVKALGAGVDRAAMKEAKQHENEAIAELERKLVTTLEAGGHSAGRNAIEKAVRALRAAAVHEEGKKLLESGHLTIDFDASGFEALGAALPETAPAGDRRALKEERRLEMQRQRIETQQQLEAERRRFEDRRREADEKRLAAQKKEHEEKKHDAKSGPSVALFELRAKHSKLVDGAKRLSAEIERAKKSLAHAETEAVEIDREIEETRLEIEALERTISGEEEE
jgi:hypothetical protein